MTVLMICLWVVSGFLGWFIAALVVNHETTGDWQILVNDVFPQIIFSIYGPILLVIPIGFLIIHLFHIDNPGDKVLFRIRGKK
jgi:hypothetical protein